MPKVSAISGVNSPQNVDIVLCHPGLDRVWLVSGLEHEFYFSIQLGMSSSQVKNSFFSEGLPPTGWIWVCVSKPIILNVSGVNTNLQAILM